MSSRHRLEVTLQLRRLFVIACLELAVPLAQLRLHFFGDEIDGRIKVIFRITRDDVLAG